MATRDCCGLGHWHTRRTSNTSRFRCGDQTGHDPLEELSDLVLAGVAGVTNLLPVGVPRLQRVVLNRDEVKVTSSKPVSPVAMVALSYGSAELALGELGPTRLSHA